MYKPEDMELPPSFGDAQSVRDHPYIGPRSNDPNLGRMLFRISNEEEARDSNPELRHEMVEKLLFEVIRQQSIYPKKHGWT
jgi:hypothetical protein